METKEQLEKAYESIKLIPAKTFKQHFNNKIDLSIEIGVNISTGSSIMVYIPFQYCKTKIGAQKYINNLINDEVVKQEVEDNEIKEIFNQLQMMQETQAKLIDTVDRGFKNINLKMQWNKN